MKALQALFAFAMFMVTFVLSSVGMWWDSRTKMLEEYDAAAAEESNGNGETEYQLAGTSGQLPNYGTSS